MLVLLTCVYDARYCDREGIMTDKAIAKHARNARTQPPDAKKRWAGRKTKSIIIHGGQSRPVVVKTCSNCGHDVSKQNISTILTRFKCLNCGQSIENTRENRCKVCHTMCADSETYNSHKWAGCPYSGSAYPVGGEMRDVEKVVK